MFIWIRLTLVSVDRVRKEHAQALLLDRPRLPLDLIQSPGSCITTRKKRNSQCISEPGPEIQFIQPCLCDISNVPSLGHYRKTGNADKIT